MPSNRGLIDRYRPSTGGSPRLPDVNSAPRREVLPPPPPAPVFSGRIDRGYVYDVRFHYSRYADWWFGGAPSWRVFIHAVEPAPWFWRSYGYIYSWPWVFGYYEPAVYVSWGWWVPVWYGRVYYPWWDWFDAPFVYFYYNYPARFSFNLTIIDDDYFDWGVSYFVVYDGGATVVSVAINRPVGIWVPGHWEQRYYVASDWVWVPGYYIY